MRSSKKVQRLGFKKLPESLEAFLTSVCSLSLCRSGADLLANLFKRTAIEEAAIERSKKLTSKDAKVLFKLKKKQSMKIQINDHRKIFAIQEEFSSLFPRLKIEFLGKPNKTGSSPSAKFYQASKTIGDCRIKHATGELTITPNMTAADLKQILSDKYGLSIALLRKSGSEWVETTDNNKLSLQEQNEESSF